MESGDLRQKNVTAMSDLLGFQGRKPSSLLFVESAQKQIDSVVQVSVGMVLTSNTGHTLALVDRDLGHRKHSDAEMPTTQ
jgi:hypothetical protein